MDKTSFLPHTSLPTDPAKRVEAVVAVCISVGQVSRDILAKYYGLTQLQASILLREFLQVHIHDVRRGDSERSTYILLGYPKRCDTIEHSESH
jgi:hypothetical protein